jgi:hypothetical protein
MRRLIVLLLISICGIPVCAYSQEDSSTVAENKTFEKVEVEASYPGGTQAWIQYLTKNLNAEVPILNNAPTGSYTVWALFVVNKDGSIMDAKVTTKWGYGMEQEVLRIIRFSGKWLPAMQKGRPVRAYRKQPVTFVVEDENFKIHTATSNTLYLKTDNVITVEADKVKNEDIQVSIKNGKITAGENGSYIVRVERAGHAIIELYNKKKDKKIGAAMFEVVARN